MSHDGPDRPTKAGQLGRFSPCQIGCHYVDMVHSFNDSRRRYFPSHGVDIWTGELANEGGSINNAGQHVEIGLGCNVAVYRVLPDDRLLQQWTRDVETGEDLEMNWETPIPAFISDEWIENPPYERFELYAFQSFAGKVVLFHKRGEKIIVYNFYTGELDYFAYPLIRREPEIAHPEGPWVLPDITEFVPRAVRTDPALVITKSTTENLDGTRAFNAAIANYGEYRTAALGDDPLERAPVVVCTHECPSVGSESEKLHGQWNGSAAEHGTPRLARYNGVWGWGVPVDGFDEAQFPPGPEEHKTGHALRLEPCDWEYAENQPQNFQGALAGEAQGLASSVYCNRIYHVPTITQALGGALYEFMRFTPGHTDESGNDVAPTSEVFPLLRTDLPFRDWYEVVEDTWPTLEQRYVIDDCVDRCGNENEDGELPLCCDPDDPNIFANFADTQFPGQCDSNPYPGVFQYAVHAQAIPVGCPGDRVNSLSIEVYGILGGDPFAELCFSEFERDLLDDRILFGTWAIYMKPDECYRIVIKATTEAGCRNEMEIIPYISPPECDFGGGVPIRLI